MYLREMNCYVFVEQKTYIDPNLSIEHINELLRMGAIRLKGKELSFQMTGFIEINGQLLISLPKGFDLDSRIYDIGEEIRVLFAVLMKYRKEAELEPDEMVLLGGDSGDIEDRMFAAYNLIDDYRLYGLIKREQKTVACSMTGVTHWPSTVNKKTPLFSNGSPVYHEAIKRRNIQDKDNMLLQLHKFALGWSLRKYSWLLGQFKDMLLEFPSELPCEEQKAIHFLNSELRRTYVSREINVIKWIANIVTGVSSKENESKVVILATRTFHTIWEAICAKVFCNQYSQLRLVLPQPEWTLNIPTPKGRISQRPDIVIIHGNKMFVLDAKYYDIGNSLPGWHDAVKQFFYALSIEINIKNNLGTIVGKELRKTAKKIMGIGNAFILPTYEDIEIKNIGCVEVNGIKEFGRINAYILNAPMAMKCYIGEQRFPLDKIIESMVP